MYYALDCACQGHPWVLLLLNSLFVYLIMSLASGISQLQSLLQGTPDINLNFSCNCPSYSRLRIPDCGCTGSLSALPFLQIQWKRVVRDEGHNAASLSTNLNVFLKVISAERRWIVTGTPTTNLLGLSFGANEETSTATCPASPKKRQRTTLHLPGKPGHALESNHMCHLKSGTRSPLRHIWNSEDRKDLRKLADMMSSFLRVLPFAADARAFDVLVTDALFAKDGPLPGATLVLEQLMSTYMVRHRIDDIEQCVQLPPVTEETVLLDLDEYGQMSYNVILSLIAVNAVDSERKDQV